MGHRLLLARRAGMVVLLGLMATAASSAGPQAAAAGVDAVAAVRATTPGAAATGPAATGADAASRQRSPAGAPVAGAAGATAAGPGAAGATGRATVTADVHHDTSAPLRTLPDTHQAAGAASLRPQKPLSRAGGAAQASPSAATGRVVPATLVNFDGVGNGFTGPQGSFRVTAAPPDTNGSVGPNHFVETVNTDLAVFDKGGATLFGPVATNTLWSGFGGLCQANNDGDATVRYDRLADRWVIQQLAVSGANGTTTPFLICVAVSTTGDPTGSYNRYAFPYATFPDYPKLSVWPDAYYLTVNEFDAKGVTFLGANVAALDRASMLAGRAATSQSFTTANTISSLLASDVDSAMPPPPGEPNFVMALGEAANTLASFKFHVDFANPASSSLSGPANLPTDPFTQACNGGGTCIPQVGGAQLDSLGDRLMFRLAYRNFGDHESLIASHTVTAGGSTGIRWYELRVSAGSPAIFQQGTYAPDAAFRWMPSIAMNGVGDIAVGFSISSATTHPGVHVAGRLPGDAPGSIGPGEATIIDGGGSQVGGLSRWGDYSGMAADPGDDCTFWYTNQYIPADGTFNWHTRVGSVRVSGCGGPIANDFSLSASPHSRSVPNNGAASFAVTTNVTSGQPVSVALSASGLPKGATASFSANPISSGGGSTLTVRPSASTPAGPATITVTAAGPTTTHTTTVVLTVTIPGSTIVANGDFETGDLSGWRTGGALPPQVVTFPVNGGSFAVELGSEGLSGVKGDGNSTLTQTIRVPAGHHTLTFFLSATCTDIVQLDQQQAQIRSTSGRTLATILDVCDNHGYQKVTFDLSRFAGRSVVLYFNVHDDGASGDPTFMRLDDVSVS